MKAFADIDLVIFDCDGVLVDSEPLANAVLAEMTTGMGWTMDGSTAQSLFKGATMDQVHQRIEAHLGKVLDLGWIGDYYAQSFRRFERELKPISGVADLVRAVVASGRKVCVASQGPPEKMALTLGVTGLAPYFGDDVFSATQVARSKPYPDLFLHAARCMAVVPARCAVIEDSRTGLSAARAAGMRVIHYDASGEGGDADISVREMAALLA